MAKSVRARQKVKRSKVKRSKVKRSKVKRSKVKRSKVKRSKVKRSKMKGGALPRGVDDDIDRILREKDDAEEIDEYDLSKDLAKDIATKSQELRIWAIMQLKELEFSWLDIKKIEGILSGVGKPLWLDTLVKYGEEAVPHEPDKLSIYNTLYSRLNALKPFYKSLIDPVDVAEHREAVLMHKLF